MIRQMVMEFERINCKTVEDFILTAFEIAKLDPDFAKAELYSMIPGHSITLAKYRQETDAEMAARKKYLEDRLEGIKVSSHSKEQKKKFTESVRAELDDTTQRWQVRSVITEGHLEE